jgi:hypothetical protein
MYAQEDESDCPVYSLEKYISKLNPKCTAFFQRPRQHIFTDEDPVWYENKPLGIHKIDSMMKNISEDAKLSIVYTNHCLRATASTILGNAGVEGRQICSVTGHKNLQSLTSYIRQPTLEQRKNMCDILHNYGRSVEEDATKAPVVRPSCTISKPPESGMISGSSTQVSTAISTSIASNSTESLFSGAQFLGDTTINVMFNKK